MTSVIITGAYGWAYFKSSLTNSEEDLILFDEKSHIDVEEINFPGTENERTTENLQ